MFIIVDDENVKIISVFFVFLKKYQDRAGTHSDGRIKNFAEYFIGSSPKPKKSEQKG